MRMDASLPSVARMRGFCRSVVLELEARYWASVGGILIEKLPVPICCNRFNVVVFVVLVVVVVADPDVPDGDVDVVELPLNVTPIGLCCVPTGGNIPNWRSVLRSTSMIVASTSTSGFALSRSSMIFSAMATRSAVSRTMMAFIAVLDIKYRILSRRSEEHTSELQSRLHLVCRLLLEKKKKQTIYYHIHAL